MRSDLRRLTVCCVLSVGCAEARPNGAPCTLPVSVALNASERLNPDLDGTPLPTVVRLYQLRAVERMEQSDFAALWEQPKETLAQDLIAARELTLFPGGAERVQIELRPEVRFVVGMAVVRQPTGSQWRSLLPMPDSASMCAAYREHGAPEPALAFQFDQYRVEGTSRLLAREHVERLPHDVAPETRP